MDVVCTERQTDRQAVIDSGLGGSPGMRYAGLQGSPWDEVCTERQAVIVYGLGGPPGMRYAQRDRQAVINSGLGGLLG